MPLMNSCLGPTSTRGLLGLFLGFLAITTAGPAMSLELKTDQSCCNLIELRQYTLHPGQRDTLIKLFDREFVEPQEALGIAVIGQFRDLDRPDRFVWMRGFKSIDARGQALTAFYDGAVWLAHREEANATMIDSDNVLLLEPATRTAGFASLSVRPIVPSSSASDPGIVVATLYYVKPNLLGKFSTLFEQSMRRALERAGARTLAEYVTSTQANNFPRLPIRQGESILVWLARFDSPAAYAAFQARLMVDHAWTRQIWPLGHEQLAQEPEILRLSPTSGSRLRG